MRFLKYILFELFKIFLGILFLVIVILIMGDPLKLFSDFDNPTRIQVFILISLVIIINTSYLIIKKVNLSLFKTIVYIIGCIIILCFTYYITIPYGNNKPNMNITDFMDTMKDNNYSISIVNNVNDLKVYDSTIYFAKKDDIKIYYIINDKARKINKVYNSFNNNNHSDCISGGEEKTSLNYKEIKCNNPNYIRIGSKNNNTMIYIEAKTESKEEINKILYDLDYIE